MNTVLPGPARSPGPGIARGQDAGPAVNGRLFEKITALGRDAARG